MTNAAGQPNGQSIPVLPAPLNRLEYYVVVGRAGDILDNGVAGGPVDRGDSGPLWLRGKVNPRGDHR